MPRRRPSAVRPRRLRCGTHRPSIHQVPGLTARPMAAVIALEHTILQPGEVAATLLAWTRDVIPGTTTQLPPMCACPGCSWEIDPRGDLERVLAALPDWA